MVVSLTLLVLGVVTAAVAPRLLAQAVWVELEPVVALWVWQCVVAAVLLSFGLSMTLSAAVAWQAVRGHLFASAPNGVIEAYELGAHQPWSAPLAVLLACGGLWTAAMLAREIRRARARRRQRRRELLVRSPLLPGEEQGAGPLVVLEGERPDAWWLPGTTPQLVITTAALQRLKGRQLDAVLAHEEGHARARHDWLLHYSAALAGGFPGIPVKVWIRFPNCAELVDGEVFAWTAKAAEVTWKDGPVTYRTWVWSSAVTRREDLNRANLGERTNRDSNRK